MTLRSFLLMLLIFFLVRPAHAQRDSLFLYNGQVLLGEIKSANMGAISIDDADLKMVHVKLYKIKRMVINNRFKIETVDKVILFGYFKSSPKDGWTDLILDDGRTLSMPITNIFLLLSMKKNFFKRLQGNVSAGFSYTKSSSIGQVNLSASIRLSAKRFNYELTASELGSIDSSKLSRDNENLQLYAGYELGPTWFLTGMVQYQRNLELSIARRYMEMLGGGDKLFIRTNWQLSVLTGVTFSQERSTAGVASGLLMEIPFMVRFNFYQFHDPNIQINSTQSVYVGLSEAGRIRYDGNTSISWEIIRYFYLTFSPYTNYDSRPPSQTGSAFDYGIVFGLSYQF